MAFAAAMLFAARMRAAGTAVAVAAMVVAATMPVNRLLEPPRSPISLTRFADNSMVTIEGGLVREPERVGDGRSYLYLRAANAL